MAKDKSGRVAALEAELEAVKLEDEFAAAKESGLGESDPAKYRKLKLKVRDARQAFREARDQTPPGPGVARPETVTGKINDPRARG